MSDSGNPEGRTHTREERNRMMLIVNTRAPGTKPEDAEATFAVLEEVEFARSALSGVFEQLTYYVYRMGKEAVEELRALESLLEEAKSMADIQVVIEQADILITTVNNFKKR